MVKPQEGVESTNTPSAEERKVSSEYTEIAQNWNHSEAEAYVKVRKDCACPFFWVCFISPHLVVFSTWISPCTQASVRRAQGSSSCSQASRAQVQLLAWPQLGALFPNSSGGDFLPSSLSLHFFFPSIPAAVPPRRCYRTRAGATLCLPQHLHRKTPWVYGWLLRAHRSPCHRCLPLCTKARAKDKLLLCKVETQRRGGRG